MGRCAKFFIRLSTQLLSQNPFLVIAFSIKNLFPFHLHFNFGYILTLTKSRNSSSYAFSFVERTAKFQVQYFYIFFFLQFYLDQPPVMLSRFGCINLGVCNLLKNILFASIRPVHARCQCQGHGLRSSVWSEGVGRVAVYTIARLLLDKRIDKFFCSSPTSGYTTFYMKFEVGKKMRIFFFATIMIGYSVNSATPPFFFLYRGLEA